MTRSDPRRWISAVEASAVFVGVTTTLTLLAVSVVLLTSIDGVLDQSLERGLARESRQLEGSIRTYVRSRLAALGDLARHPLVVPAVTDDRIGPAMLDLLETSLLLGEQHPLALADFEGELIGHSSEEVFGNMHGGAWRAAVLQRGEPWVGVVPGAEDGSTPARWCLVAPVLYNGEPEGALIAAIEFDSFLPDLGLPEAGFRAEFAAGDRIVGRYGDPDVAATQRREIADMGLELRYGVDTSAPRAAGRALIARVVPVLLVIFACAMLAQFYLGRRFLVGPLRRLSEQVAAFDSAREPPSLEMPPISELVGLASAFEELGRRVRSRDGELRGVAEELEARVAERTRELSEALSLAEEGSRAKSEFLATMSHEIRTPLNGVLGMAELLARSDLSGEQRDWAESISSSGNLLLSILNDVLDLAKIESGKLRLERIPFAPEAVCRDVVSLMMPQARSAGIELTLDWDERCPERLIGDPGRLGQVAFNLVSNAVKFTREGLVHVSVICREVSAGHATLELVVADTGIGMDAVALARIFEKFTQLDASTARRFGGSGLGLAIVHNLVAMMGGEVRVDSLAGLGSRFEVTLRFERAAGPVAVDDAPARAAHRSGAGLRVLLVEDQPINQKVAQKMLEKLGCEVSLAVDGEQGFAAWAESSPDLVFMDCQMPGVDGYEATHRIRAREAEQGLPRTPVIALTANSMQGDRERCLDAGMDDFVSKPVGLTDFERVLLAWRDKRKSR